MKYCLTYEGFMNEKKFADSFKKNSYVELKKQDVKDFAKDIFDLINIAYANKGGNLELKTADDISKSDITYWLAKDIDDDPDADIVIGGKPTSHGFKLTVLGQDGSSPSKRDMVQKMIELMKTRGFYAELDVNLAQKLGLKHITDEKKIRSVLNKDIEYKEDGSYDRNIAGDLHRKVLVGIPK